MSEYIEIETELGDELGQVIFHTNLELTIDGREQYATVSEMDEGSPLAQMLAPIEGITGLELEGQKMIVQFDPSVAWHQIVADATAVLKEFFL